MTRAENLRALFEMLGEKPELAAAINWEAFDKHAAEAGLERVDGMLVTKEQADLYRSVMERPE